MTADSVSGEGVLPGSHMMSSCCVLIGGRGEVAPWGLSYKGTNSIHENSTLMSKSPPKGPTSSDIT